MSEPSTATERKRPRRTQAQRSAATRGAILDATIDCLVEYGYAGTTTPSICRRAGVSRGAQVHHFPTKADLVAEALQHLARRRIDELPHQLARHGEARNLEAAIRGLWSSFEGPLFVAAAELWIATRTDAALRQRLRPIERNIGRLIWALAYEIFPEQTTRRPDLERNFRAVLNMMRGLGISAGIREGPLPVDELVEISVELLEGIPDPA